jgi:hypothetical protein
MTLEVDVSRAHRRPKELRALVAGVEAARPEDEADWIEWKSTMNLADRETRATLARHIIGMANRRVEEAGRFAQGFGFILAGIEPGNRCGVSAVDLADLDAGIESYLGQDGPRWTATYDTASEGVSVLVITVDPPRDGDSIHTLRRDFGKYRAGDIFVRKSARTERAGPGDISYLAQRAAKRHLRLEIDVHTDPVLPLIPPLVGLADFIDSWLARQRDRLLASLKGPALGPPHGESHARFDDDQIRDLEIEYHTGKTLTDLQKAAVIAVSRRKRYNRFLSVHAERRTADEYRAEIEEYLTLCREFMLHAAYSAYVDKVGHTFEVEIVNTTDRNFRDVRVSLSCEDGGYLFTGDIARLRRHMLVDPKSNWPVPPLPFGPQISEGNEYRRSVRASPSRPNRPQGLVATEQLRPGASYRQQCYLIATKPDTTAPIQWEATAVNVDGRLRGVFTVRAGGEHIRAAGLLQLILADLPDFLLKRWDPPGDMRL